MNEDRLGACEVCWTNSWEPVEAEKECDASHPHEGEHVRCGYCWLHQAYLEVRAELDALKGGRKDA